MNFIHEECISNNLCHLPCFYTLLGYREVKMSLDYEDMEHDDDVSESEFEVISVDPNINYETDEESVAEHQELEKPACQHQETQVEEVAVESPEIKVESMYDEVSSYNMVTQIDDNSMDSQSNTKVRKKLNLQEYKKRRANEKADNKPLFDIPRKIAFELCDVPSSLPNLILPTDTDSIRLLTNCKGVIKKESESDTSSPTAIFNSAYYEEIVIVSAGCQTEVTIPPLEDGDDSEPASKFLTNIVNNLMNKDQGGAILNSSTSLFSSIQAVVHEKCASTYTDIEQSCENVKGTKEHGEDKTIMHLRKDRLRPFKCTAGIQTDDISLFPPLLLSPALVFNRIRNARNFRRKLSRTRSRSRSRSFSPSIDYERFNYHSNRYSRSQHSTHSSSMSSSSSESDSDSSSSQYSSSRSSSDSLNRFNDRENFRFYNRNQRDQGFGYEGETAIYNQSLVLIIFILS